MIQRFYLLAIFLFLPFMVQAASVTTLSCSRNDVNAAINNTAPDTGGSPQQNASDGDIIHVAAGTCTWAAGIIVPSNIGITIIGAGTNGQYPIGSGVTVIIDNWTGVGKSFLFLFQPTCTASCPSTSRLSSIELRPNTGLSANALNAPIGFQGTCNATSCPNIREDHMVFPSNPGGGIPDWGGLVVQSATLNITDNVFGVMDHNTMVSTGSSYFEFVDFNHSSWFGIGNYGDNSWASADSFGTNQALYVETNYYQVTGTSSLSPLTEAEAGFNSGLGEGGGRVVCRFNTGVGMRSMCSNHGTESNGRSRGGRQMEYYFNSMDCPAVPSTTSCHNNGMNFGPGIRSGSLYAFNNNYTTKAVNAFASTVEYRATFSFNPWKACDGNGLWDKNDGVVYYSDTILSVSGSNPYTITVSGSPGWTAGGVGVGQWVPTGAPYSIHDSTIGQGTEIKSNGTNTLTTVSTFNGIAFAPGDSIIITRSPFCMDQSSRIGGSLLSGASPTPDNTGAYSYQILDPMYEAADQSNVAFPVFGSMDVATNRIIANRDFYSEASRSAQSNPTTPFNGTSGTGFGTLANRPTTCTPSVGYWANDQGNWNTSGLTGADGSLQGVLYICTSTNTWTLIYTPYTYPHPLIIAPAVGFLSASISETLKSPSASISETISTR